MGLNSLLKSEVTGTIISNKPATVNILTENNTNKDYYIKLNLNAGYTWNDLALVNQFDYFSKTTSIIAYVDGVEVSEYPGGCNYTATLKRYKGNSEVELKNKLVTCDNLTKEWNISYTGFANKIKIYFEEIKATTFAEDSWDTMAAVIKSGQLSAYPVGSEKEVEIGGTSYTVRVANNTIPDECNGTDFSQTACGFVVEFVDIVEQRNMNPSGTYKGTQYDFGWNVDGWPATEMRTYANGDFFNKLPSDLQNVIIDTKVISGHSSKDTNNFTSTDKIYLLSAHEVWEDGTSDQVSTYDTANNNTRQLDYYANLGVTTNNYSGAIKQYNSSAVFWWLRTAITYIDDTFLLVNKVGGVGDLSYPKFIEDFAPAFRIG